MRVDSKIKLVANICVSVVLLILYVYFFGHQSVSKYLDKAVITTSKDATSLSIIILFDVKELSSIVNLVSKTIHFSKIIAKCAQKTVLTLRLL